MITQPTLRPLERTVVSLSERGLTNEEIGARLAKQPRTVAFIQWAAEQRLEGELPPATRRPRSGLRAVETVVLDHLGQGRSLDDVATMLRRSPGHVDRIRAYAEFKTTGTLDVRSAHDGPDGPDAQEG